MYLVISSKDRNKMINMAICIVDFLDFLPAFNILALTINTPLITLTLRFIHAWLSNTKIVTITHITPRAFVWNITNHIEII